MDTIGHLQLLPSHTSGTVVVTSTNTNAVVAIAHCNDRGWFQCDNLTEGEGLVFYGFSGEGVSEANAEQAIQRSKDILYAAIFAAGSDPNNGIYLNAASTLVYAHQKLNASAGYVHSSKAAMTCLFSDFMAVQNSGYTAGFFCHIAPNHMIDPALFLQKAEAAGGSLAYAEHLAQNISVGDEATSFPFGGARIKAEQAKAFVQAETTENDGDNPPDILPSSNWATDDDDWEETLTAAGDDDYDIVNSMSDLAKTTNGLAAGLEKDAVAFSMKDVEGWLTKAGGALGGSLSSMVASQLMTLVSTWIFGSHPSPVQQALQAISAQLKKVLKNQTTMLGDLSAIIADLDQMGVNLDLDHLTNSIASIQTYSQRLYGYANTPGTGVHASTLQQTAGNITNTDNSGIQHVLNKINDVITGASGGTSLHSALLQYCLGAGTVHGLNRNFLGNNQCYMYVQGLFHYYMMVQTQGVQLYVQASNYLANPQTVPSKGTAPSSSTKLVVSAQSKPIFDMVMLGGSGYEGSAAFVKVQRDGFRSAFWPYFKTYQGILGQLPADMAVCPIPTVVNQKAPIYYCILSKQLVVSVVSGKLRTWTSGTDVFAQNTHLIPTAWTLPEGIDWQYPSYNEFQNILGPAIGSPGYSNNLFKFLTDQEFTTEGYLGQSVNDPIGDLFTRDSADQSSAWKTNTESWRDPSVGQSPSDVNYNLVSMNKWKPSINPWSAWWYDFSGTFPITLTNNNAQEPISSKCYDVYNPTSSSHPWQYYWFGVSGAIIVSAPIPGYLPIGSYVDSCKDIKVILTCEAKNNAGDYVSASFDLTNSSSVGLVNNDGVLAEDDKYYERTKFQPDGPYTANCKNIKVALQCQASVGYGSYVSASFDLTPYTLTGVALANTGGTITG